MCTIFLHQSPYIRSHPLPLTCSAPRVVPFMGVSRLLISLYSLDMVTQFDLIFVLLLAPLDHAVSIFEVNLASQLANFIQ